MAEPKYHPAFTVSDIKNYISITLELDKSQYTRWAELFKITCTAFDVIDHIITPTESSESATVTSDKSNTSNVSWFRLDAVVLNWMYGTVSLEVLNTIFEAGSTAAKTWLRIQNLFQDNKSSRALYLQRQFTNIKLDNFPNVSAYCQELKSIADQLENVDEKLSDPRIVLQLIAGLNDNYDTIGSQMAHITPLPLFYQARSMLLLEETRKQKQPLSPSTPADAALISTTGNSSSNKSPVSANQPYPGNNYRGRGSNWCNSYRGRNSNTRGRGLVYYPNSSPTWNTQPPWNWQQAPWNYSPPCPYPTFSWARPNSAQPSLLGPRPAQAHSVSSDTFCPTDIESAMHTMTLHPPEDTWYMDTGATSHMASS
ncbi:uncharacterized protein [Rutidosis leptorrhynchoides]|uniref:uncharacterized protein n=1 Tax=Rutidosis leptorrhynchoides TaxID=125765 RepID=UPI003A9A4950